MLTLILAFNFFISQGAHADFDGTRLVGILKSADPLGCKNSRGNYIKYRLKISFDQRGRDNSTGDLHIASTYDQGIDSKWQDFIDVLHINEGPYISSNTCFSDGQIFRSTTTATDLLIKTKVELLEGTWLCEPRDSVIDEWTRTDVEIRETGEFLINGCAWVKE